MIQDIDKHLELIESSIAWAKEFKKKGGKILGITEDFTVKAYKNSI